jgi:hypothetical protein
MVVMNDMAPKFLLTITASVNPSAESNRWISRTDPQLRLRDYQQALRFWLLYPDRRIDKILFIENSGHSLESLRHIAVFENPLAKTVEFVSLDCNWCPPNGNYGYSEMKMLDEGLRESHLRTSTTHMVKVSGRLTFPSLTKLLNRLPPEFDVVVDSREWRAPFKRHKRPFVPTQMAIFSHAFYDQHFRQTYGELDQEELVMLEWMFYDKLQSFRGQRGVILRFPCNADPSGHPAHRKQSYNHPAQKAVQLCRGVARQVFPNFWI